MPSKFLTHPQFIEFLRFFPPLAVFSALRYPFRGSFVSSTAVLAGIFKDSSNPNGVSKSFTSALGGVCLIPCSEKDLFGRNGINKAEYLNCLVLTL